MMVRTRRVSLGSAGAGGAEVAEEVAAEAEIGRSFDLPEERLRRWMDPVEAVRSVRGR